MLAHHTTSAEGGQHRSRPVEIGHFDVRRANSLRVVCVGPNAGRKIEALHEIDRLQVVRLVGDFGIEDFDDIQMARPCERLQDTQLESGALGVKRVRRVDQTSLRLDPLHDIGHRQNVRNPFGKVQSNELAGGSPNLFADDDASADIPNECLRQLGRLDAMVVGDAYDVELHRLDALDQLIKSRAGIPRRDRVQVTIEAHPAGRSRGRRPNRQQHQEGD